MNKKINLEWTTAMLNDNSSKIEAASELPRIDWVSNNRGFKRGVQFKVVAANSKENDIFSTPFGWTDEMIEVLKSLLKTLKGE